MVIVYNFRLITSSSCLTNLVLGSEEFSLALSVGKRSIHIFFFSFNKTNILNNSDFKIVKQLKVWYLKNGENFDTTQTCFCSADIISTSSGM
ncbi:hypothetical protein BpHYR1_052161 [Brachionus plicatilis]|uniref:Uncharacterized protein n=1 Tax=Brachionus plicatilis TaxID=10195 RepID=A0A3M7R519_BRAPC|nr:hypothetical protein BpHYR1_052161 [Brachionus plicatilis]